MTSLTSLFKYLFFFHHDIDAIVDQSDNYCHDVSVGTAVESF